MAVLRRALPLALLLACWPVPRAQAFPAFSRQTGGACTLCHFQDMHSLNAYGREFLQNSFHETPGMLRQRRKMQKRAEQGGLHGLWVPDTSRTHAANKGARLPADEPRETPAPGSKSAGGSKAR